MRQQLINPISDALSSGIHPIRIQCISSSLSEFFFLIITLSFYFFYLLFVCLYMWERFRWSPKYYERKTTFTNAHVFLIYYTEINTPSLLSPVVVVLCCCCTSRLAGFRIDRPEGNVRPSMVRCWEFAS